MEVTEKPKKNIVLIGFRATGKTSVGREIAQRLGRDFLDTDELVESRAGTSLRELVRKHGEEYLRVLESEVLEECARREGVVIAAGAGALLSKKNTERLKENGFLVHLEADPRIITKRLQMDPAHRERMPILTGKGGDEEVTYLLEYRKPFYEEAQDLAINTEEMTWREVADHLMEILKKEKGWA